MAVVIVTREDQLQGAAAAIRRGQPVICEDSALADKLAMMTWVGRKYVNGKRVDIITEEVWNDPAR